MFGNHIKYSGTDVAGGPSWELWKDCPLTGNPMLDANALHGFYDNFSQIAYDPTTTAAFGPYLGFLDAGSTILPVADARYSGLILTEATATEAVWLQGGRGVNLPFLISDTAGSRKKLWFEAEFSLGSITAAKNHVLCGLGSGTLSETIPIAVDDTWGSTCNFLGFRRSSAGTTGLDFVGKKTGAATVTVYGTAVGTLALSTFIKAGFVFDPLTRRVEIYINGVKNADFVTTTELTDDVFPNDVGMHAIAGHYCKADGGATTLKWWSCYQMR